MIRIQGVIAAAIITVLVAVFGIFFLNPLVKMALIAGGEKVFLAKTEISRVKVDAFKSKITIKGLVIADKNKEFKNLFEAAEVTSDIQLFKLFLKKVIIDKSAVLDLALGTDRKTSGFLPPAKLKKLEKEAKTGGFMDGLKDKIGEKAGGEIADIPAVKLADMAGSLKDKDLKSIIKTEELESYKKIKEIEAGVKAEKDKASDAIAAVNIDPKIKSSTEALERIKAVKVAGAADIPAAKKGLEDLAKIKSDLDAAMKEINEAKAAAESFAAYSTGSLKEIDKAKEADINAALKGMNMNILDAGSLEKVLIGPVWYDRVTKALEIAALAKKYIPVAKKKGKNKTAVRKRRKGRDVVFIAELPELWIKLVEISTKGGGDKLLVKGYIKDITTEQAAIGRPLVFSLSAAKGGIAFGAEGRIDHVTAVNDEYSVTCKNLPPDMTGMKDMDYGSVKLKSAYLDSDVKVNSTDETLSLKGNASMKKMSFESGDKNNIAFQVLSGIDALKMFFEVKNTKSGPSITVSSDAFDAIKKALAKIYGKKVEEAKAQVKKEIEARVASELKKLTDGISADKMGLNDSVKGQEDKLKGVNSRIDGVKASLTKQMAGAGAGGALQNLFK